MHNTIYPISLPETLEKLDKLARFLQYHFKEETEAFESYQKIAGDEQNYNPHDYTFRNILSDIECIISSINISGQEIDTLKSTVNYQEERVAQLESKIGNLLAEVEYMRSTLNTLTESKNTDNKMESDK